MTILGKPLNRVPVVFVKECGYVPSVLCNAEGYIDKHIETKELFQVQGCSNKVTSLLFQLSSPKGFSKLAKVDVHDVIEAVKAFLVAMPEPLLADDVCDRLIEASQTDNNLGAILGDLRAANPSHFAIMHFMMRMLGKVADPGNKNGMDIRKLATIFVLDILKPLKIDDNSDVPISFPTNRMKRLPYLIMVVEHLMEHLDLFKVRSTSPSPSAVRQAKAGNRCHSSQGAKFPSDSSTRLTVRPVSAPDAYHLGSFRRAGDSDFEYGDHLAPVTTQEALLSGILNPPFEKNLINEGKCVGLYDAKNTVNHFKRTGRDPNIIDSYVEALDNRSRFLNVGTKCIPDCANIMKNCSNSGSKTVADSSKSGGDGPKITSSIGSKNATGVTKILSSKAPHTGCRFAGGRSKFMKCDSEVSNHRNAADGQVSKISSNSRRSTSSRPRLSVPRTTNTCKLISNASSKVPTSSHNVANSGSMASCGPKGVSSSCTSGLTNSEISELVKDIVDLAKHTCLIDHQSTPGRLEKPTDTEECKPVVQEQKSLVKTNLHKYSPNLRLMKSNTGSKVGKSASASKNKPQCTGKTQGTQSRQSLSSHPKKKMNDPVPCPKAVVDKQISNKNKVWKKTTVDAKRWMGNHPSRKPSFSSDKRPMSPRSSLTQPKKIKRGKKKNSVSLRPSASDIADFSSFQPGEEIGPWLQSGSMSDTNMDISVLNKTIQQPRVLEVSPINKSRSDKCAPKKQDNPRRKKKKGDVKWKGCNIRAEQRSPPRRRDNLSPSRSSQSSFYSVTESPSKKSVNDLKKTCNEYENDSKETTCIVSTSSHDVCIKSLSVVSVVSRRSSSLINVILNPKNKYVNDMRTEKPTEKINNQNNVVSPRKRNRLKQRSTEVIKECVSKGVVGLMSTLNTPPDNQVSDFPKVNKSLKREKKTKSKVDKLTSFPKESKNVEREEPLKGKCEPSDDTEIENLANRRHSTQKKRKVLSQSSIQLDVPLKTTDKPPERASSLSNIQELLSCSCENARLQHPAAMPLLGKPSRVSHRLHSFGYESNRIMFRHELARRKHDRRSAQKMCYVPSHNVQRCVDVILIITFLAMACFVVLESFRTKKVE